MIQGEKIYLTAVEKSSLEQLRTWRNKPELRKYFREYREISSDMQESWYKNRVLENDKQIDFEIRDISTNNLIGHCGLYYISWVNRTAELTIYIGDAKYRNGGYGKDALTLLMNYAFDTVNLNRVWCEVFSNNEAIHVYRKLGFIDEGKLREHHYEDGKYIDCYMLGLLKSDWVCKQSSANDT